MVLFHLIQNILKLGYIDYKIHLLLRIWKGFDQNTLNYVLFKCFESDVYIIKLGKYQE